MSIARRWASYKGYLKREFSEPAPSLGWRLRGMLKGHPSTALAMLEDRAYREHDYFSYTLQTRRYGTYNHTLSKFLFNKLHQKLWLDHVMPSVAPPVTHYTCGRRLFSLAGEERELDTLLALLAEKGELFLKPAASGQGHGATRLAQLPDGILINGERTDPERWLDGISRSRLGSYIVSDIVRQGPWSEAFFPPTLNTLRVLTGTHFSDHRPVILAATMKTGRPETYPTDNWHSGTGGIAAKVDVDSGELAAGLFYNSGLRRRDQVDVHPQSGVRIKGAVVPDWPALRSVMLRLAGLLPHPGLVGWDVALMRRGVVIVEANTTPGLDIHHCHGSLKQTVEQRGFWAEMGM